MFALKPELVQRLKNNGLCLAAKKTWGLFIAHHKVRLNVSSGG